MTSGLEKTGAEQALAQGFAAARPRLPGADGVDALRARAFGTFEQKGLPHRRVEDWKYTDLRALMREALPMAPLPDKDALARAQAVLAPHALGNARRIVLVDGALAPQLSDLDSPERGLSLRPLAAVLASRDAPVGALMAQPDEAVDPLLSLNTALMTDGIVIDVAENARIARPVHLVHVASGGEPAAMYTRSLVRLAAGAHLTLVEQFVAGAADVAYQVNDALVMELGAGARLDHSRLMEDDMAAINVSTLAVKLGDNAHLATFNLTSGASVSRYQAFIRFEGSGANVETNGVNLLKGSQHGDTSMFLDHAVPGCSSREVFRAVLDGRARSVFQGRIVVRPDAQKTDARMMTRAILLTDEAESDSKPELEIYADDVACSHGSTSGALDQGLLFYLRARGLPEPEAQAMLIQAFVGETIEAIADDVVREAALQAAARYLTARRT
ncbi:MAG: Fe-S cluster assembly protein SufD [Xanthobacteraceae bacterium]|nr:MAG: Fe-S cluster assembly protein SufD [Xanthobacteraceae bacterium]